MKRHTFRFIFCVLATLLMLVPRQTFAAVVYDEDSDGDFSGVYSNPTPLSLVPGTNSIVASTGNFDGVDDLEYVRVDVPAGYQLSQLLLGAYVGQDQRGFIGLQSGSAFTFAAPDAFSHINDMLGWSHFGPGEGHDSGTDLLPIIGLNGQGFVPPLSGSTYTFWIQQTGAVMDYRLDFVVTPVPEPGTSLLVGFGGVALAATRRRRRTTKLS
jgi:PEP-CTERM motif